MNISAITRPSTITKTILLASAVLLFGAAILTAEDDASSAAITFEELRAETSLETRNADLDSMTSTVKLEPGTTAPCIPRKGFFCAWDRRFEVQMIWADPRDRTFKHMDWLEYSDVAVLANYGNAANVEVMVKVLPACNLNNHFWVFAGGVTDRYVAIIIRDTWTGRRVGYENLAGNAFRTVNDTTAIRCN